MSILRPDPTLDLSGLDPENITSASTPRLVKQAGAYSPTDEGTLDPPVGLDDELKDEMIDYMDEHEPASAYSLHLSAMGRASANSTLDLDQEITRLESEEIGGPSDFTLNLADWINGTKGPGPLAAEAQQDHDIAREVITGHRSAGSQAEAAAYKSPSIEEYETPKAPRTSDSHHTNALSSSNGTHTHTSLVDAEGKDSSVSQQQDWKALCAELERKNDDLTCSLDEHRRALEELKHDAPINRLSSTAEMADLKAQLSLWERSATRSFGDSTTLGDNQQSALSSQDEASDVARRACVALVGQQTRIEELQKTLETERQDRAAETAEAEQRQQSQLEQAQQVRRQAHSLKQQVLFLQQQSTARGASKQSRQTSPNPEKSQLQQQVSALEAQLASSMASHTSEIAALRSEYQGVAADVDEWVVKRAKQKDEQYAATLARRDRKIEELKSRNAELQKVYALCGKELMLAWGREEFGEPKAGEKQLYRYRFALNSKA